MTKLALPPCVISFMNLKGGTGKTTLAIAFSEALSLMFRKKILLIDCDFQCSASMVLLGRNYLSKLLSDRKTVDCAILDMLAKEGREDLLGHVVASQLAVSEATDCLKLLPASPNMPRSERAILAHYIRDHSIEEAYERSSSFIADAFRALLAQYAFIILDCPPGVTLFSEAAVRASDFLVVPTLPNELSIAAIDHLRSEVGRITPNRSFESLHLGTVVSKLRSKSAVEHYTYQTDTIQKLLDRMDSRFAILQPYLPFCRELEGTCWREPDARPWSFAGRYGRVSPKIEQLALALVQRAAARQTAGRKTAA